MSQMPDFHNLYTYFVQVTVSLLMGNIFTLQTHNDTLDVLTNTNQKLTEAWTTSPETGTDVANAIAAIVAAPPGDNPGQQAYMLQAFINNNMASGGGFPISHYSQAIGAQLMQLVASNYKDLGDPASTDMSAVNSFNSIISAQGQNEEQIGQNGAKTEGSVVQQDTSTQQTIANCDSSIETIFSNLSSLVQQIYS